MSLFVVFFQHEPPIVDSAPQSGDGVTSVELRLDERAARTLEALDALASVEVAHALGAVFLAGLNAGERAARGAPRGSAPAPS